MYIHFAFDDLLVKKCIGWLNRVSACQGSLQTLVAHFCFWCNQNGDQIIFFPYSFKTYSEEPFNKRAMLCIQKNLPSMYMSLYFWYRTSCSDRIYSIFPNHKAYYKWYQTISLYTHSLPIIVFEKKKSDLRVLGLKKASKFDLFQKFKNQNLHFWIFSKTSFRNDLHTPILPYFNTQHSICDFFIFLHFVCRGY